MENPRRWYDSPAGLFLFAAGFMAPTAFFSRADNWFTIGNDLSRLFLNLGVAYVLNAAVYFSVQRGKYGVFLLSWMSQLHFWLSLVPILALIHYGYLSKNLALLHYSNYPAVRGQLSGAIEVAEVFVLLGGVVFISNIVQAVSRAKHAPK